MDRAKRKRIIISGESSDSDQNELKISKSKKSKKSKSESKDRDRSRSRSVKRKSSKKEKSKHKKDKKSKSKSKKKHKSRSRSKRKSRNSARSRSKSSDSDSLSTCSNSSSAMSFKSANDSLSKQKSPSPNDVKKDRPAQENVNLIDTDSEQKYEANGILKNSNDENEGNPVESFIDESETSVDVADKNDVIDEAMVVEIAEEENDLALTVTAADADALANIDSISRNKLMDEIELAFLTKSDKMENLTDLDLYTELEIPKDHISDINMENSLLTATDTDVHEINSTNSFETTEQQAFIATNESDNKKIDQISIMVQTEYHIDPDNLTSNNMNNKTLLDKAIYCNTDPLYIEKDDKILTMTDIEKLLSVVDDKIAELNVKKKHLLSLKQEKMLKKKKIQNVVNSKNSFEFGLFDNCLTLTKKGTLRIEHTSSVNKNKSKSNPVTSPIVVERNHIEPSIEKEKSEIVSKNNGHEKKVKKRSKTRRAQDRIELDSSDSEIDKKVAHKTMTEAEEIPQKKRKLLSGKYSKKTNSRKNYKSLAMVMEDSSDSDNRTISINKNANPMKKQLEQEKGRKCYVSLKICDLNQMKEDLIKNMLQEKQKIIEISQDNVVNEEVIETGDDGDNFEILVVSDHSSCSDNECNLDNNNHSNIDRADKSDDAVDILKLLDKKHEVITEFIT